MKYIALFDEWNGIGKSLQEAFEDLESNYDDVDREQVEFFEANPIEVEFKIVKKDIVKSVKKVCP